MALTDELILAGGLVAFPLLLSQALYARRRTPVLPAVAPGREQLARAYTPTGRSNPQLSNAPLKLYLLGESTVAGVGVDTFEQTLGARLAHHLSERLRRDVSWDAFGLAGADVRECLAIARAELVPKIEVEPPDGVVVVVGVNDTKNFTSRSAWRARLEQLLASLRAHTPSAIIVAGVPPMEHFTALPTPLRQVLGARARLMDAVAQRVANSVPNCRHVPTRPEFEARYLARDGFHPSAEGYDRWARELSRRVTIAPRASMRSGEE